MALFDQIVEADREMLARRVSGYRAASNRVAAIEQRLTEATTEQTRARLQAELDAARESSEAAKEQALEAWHRQQALLVTQAIIGTAASIVQAIASVPPPYSYVLAGINATMGAIQVGLIAAQPPPQLHSGSNSLLRDETLIRARQGEAVLSPTGVAAAGGEGAVRALNKGRAGGAAQTIVVQQRLRARVLDAQVYDLGRSGRGALQQQISRGKARPGSHRPAGMR